MFEIVSRAIPPWWTVHDPYGTGVVVIVGPEAWADPAYSIGRESQESTAFDTFRREVERMYAAAGEASPSEATLSAAPACRNDARTIARLSRARTLDGAIH